MVREMAALQKKSLSQRLCYSKNPIYLKVIQNDFKILKKCQKIMYRFVTRKDLRLHQRERDGFYKHCIKSLIFWKAIF